MTGRCYARECLLSLSTLQLSNAILTWRKHSSKSGALEFFLFGLMTKTADSTVDRIRSFILRTFPAARKRGIEDDSPLLESGIIDSLGMLDLVAFLEQTFEIKVEDEELVPENFATLQSLTAFAERKQHEVASK